jgi:threonine synthase
MKMGLPIAKLVIATNENDILSRFWATGAYEIHGVSPTISPSMDIQIASNFERYLYDLQGRSAERVRGLMANLRQQGGFSLDNAAMAKARQTFDAGAADEAATKATIKRVLAETGELVDPHTAVGLAVAETHDEARRGPAPMIVLATASAAKFPDAVTEASGVHPTLPPHLADLMEREERLETAANDLATVQTLIRSRFRP